MTAVGNKLHVQEYVYDFAVDGGAAGEIVLSDNANKAAIPIGAIIKGVYARVLTAVTSDGSATVSWGNGDDADGYSGSAIAKASLTQNAIFNGWDNGAALLWDDSNDHPIYQYVADADDGKFSITVGTAALTAGKIAFYVEYMMPGTQS
jgi:hypothetical protein